MEDDHGHEMPAESAALIVRTVRSAGVAVVVAGGWAVDALLRDQTRPHADLDVWLPASQLDRLIEAVVTIGIDRLYPWGDDRPWNFVLHNGGALRVDLHMYETLDDRSLHYGSVASGITIPAEALAGSGVINNIPLVCESPEWVLRWHTGYPLRPVDRHDMARLCERYGFGLPNEYV